MAGSFDRDIRCRGDRRKVHWQTRLPLLWKCELVNRDTDNELMEATEGRRCGRAQGRNSSQERCGEEEKRQETSGAASNRINRRVLVSNEVRDSGAKGIKKYE